MQKLDTPDGGVVYDELSQEQWDSAMALLRTRQISFEYDEADQTWVKISHPTQEADLAKVEAALA